MLINIGRWTEDELDQLIREAAKPVDPGERIALISERFLNIPYQESTLIGSAHCKEELVINLDGMDCFTFLDYVEALRLSRSFPEFKDMLRQVRYREGLVSYRTRNHFFSDWAEYRPDFVRDATQETGGGRAKSSQKILNKKDDGSPFVNGVKPVNRTISYIPTDIIDTAMLQKLGTGDYAGIYADSAGLDVSHVGIIIKKGGTCLFRHASSAKVLQKIVDQDFMQYIKGKPGLIILRPS